MELIITALMALFAQGGKLLELWGRVGKEGLTTDEIAAEITAIMDWLQTTNEVEDAVLQAALKKALAAHAAAQATEDPPA